MGGRIGPQIVNPYNLSEKVGKTNRRVILEGKLARIPSWSIPHITSPGEEPLPQCPHRNSVDLHGYVKISGDVTVARTIHKKVAVQLCISVTSCRSLAPGIPITEGEPYFFQFFHGEGGGIMCIPSQPTPLFSQPM